MGTQSFGKGLVQTITPLSFNTSLKITTAKYYTPSGRCIQRIDYSKDNQVIPEPDSIKKNEFSTDNKRLVYSAGGITPDTTVKNAIDTDLLKDLLAKGTIFNFADKYYYKNIDMDFDKINRDKMLSEFKNYLSETNYEYESDVEKKINEVVKHLKENHNSKDLNKTLEKLNSEVKEMFKIEFDESTDEIVSELRIELAHRYLGSDAGIKEGLKFDKQFNMALSLLKDESNYLRLLNNGKSN